MAFIQKIIQKISCPRCNAEAQLRAEDRNEYVIIMLQCPKCKLERRVGLTTRKALNLKKRRLKLEKRLEQAKSPAIRKQIEVKIKYVDERARKAEVGI